MKGILSCCEGLFEWTGANVVHIQARNVQNVQNPSCVTGFRLGYTSIIIRPPWHNDGVIENSLGLSPP